jgi:ribosomal-protein-alanine N-acetyltransferase
MNLRLTDFTETHARDICTWKYDGEYSIYNYPEWDKISNEKLAITMEEKRKNEFLAVINDYNRLCGYLRLMDKHEYILVGIGLKPSLCGKGLGSTLMEILKQHCERIYPNKNIILEVRSFNKRAINCYKKSGFKAEYTYQKDTPIGPDEFIRMKY